MSPLLALAALVAAPQQADAGAMAAVETCLKVLSPQEVDFAKLVKLEWTEQAIDGIEQSPGGAAGTRLFTYKGLGAVILVITDPKTAIPHCDVMTLRSEAEVEAIVQAIAKRLGGAVVPLSDYTAVTSGDHRFLARVTRKPDKGGVFVTIQFLAVDPAKQP